MYIELVTAYQFRSEVLITVLARGVRSSLSDSEYKVQ